MSAALKFATLASGFTLFGAATYHTFRTPKQEFSQNALALEHSDESLPKAPKMPSNFMAFTIGGYEIKNSA